MGKKGKKGKKSRREEATEKEEEVEIFDYEMPEGAINLDSDADSENKDDIYKALDIDLSEAIKEPPKKIEPEKPKITKKSKEVVEEKTKSKKKSKKSKEKKDKKKKKKVKENGEALMTEPVVVQEPVVEIKPEPKVEPVVVEPEKEEVVEEKIET